VRAQPGNEQIVYTQYSNAMCRTTAIYNEALFAKYDLFKTLVTTFTPSAEGRISYHFKEIFPSSCVSPAWLLAPQGPALIGHRGPLPHSHWQIHGVPGQADHVGLPRRRQEPHPLPLLDSGASE
jgi:hypothetical protein